MSGVRTARVLTQCIASIALLLPASCDQVQEEPEETWIAEPTELRVDYAIEVEDERTDGGAFRAGKDFRFRSGDRFRLALRPDFEAHAYLFHRAGGDSSYAQLFPDQRISVRNPLAAHETTQIPDEDRRWSLDTKKGIEHLVLVVSSAPWDVEEQDSRGRIKQEAFERQLAELEMTRRPDSYSSTVEDGWTKLFFDGELRDAATIARVPMTHE